MPLTQIMVALPGEAKALIAYYGLKRRLSETAFSIYEKDGVCLTVSGVGKVAMAAAVSYVHVLFGVETPKIWLNPGIAGHPRAGLGELFIAHKITDVDTDQCWYPPLCFTPPCPSEQVFTVSKVLPDYPCDGLYEMEASAFQAAATRFCSAELVHSLKIVSDNREFPATRVNARQVSELIGARVEEIEAVRRMQCELAQEAYDGETIELDQYIGRWHFSAQQRYQLQQALWRWRILAPAEEPPFERLRELRSAKQVLQWLTRRLQELPIRL